MYDTKPSQLLAGSSGITPQPGHGGMAAAGRWHLQTNKGSVLLPARHGAPASVWRQRCSRCGDVPKAWAPTEACRTLSHKQRNSTAPGQEDLLIRFKLLLAKADRSRSSIPAEGAAGHGAQREQSGRGAAPDRPRTQRCGGARLAASGRLRSFDHRQRWVLGTLFLADNVPPSAALLSRVPQRWSCLRLQPAPANRLCCCLHPKRSPRCIPARACLQHRGPLSTKNPRLTPSRFSRAVAKGHWGRAAGPARARLITPS